MAMRIKSPVLVLLFFTLPSVSFAAALTQQQSTSLIAVVQSSPGIPASAFVSLITAFSNITTAQASSLITVVQSAPGVPANAFVDLLTSFTVDTPTKQADVVPAQTVVPTVTPVATQTAQSAGVEISPYASGGNVDPQNDMAIWRASISVTGNAVSMKELRLMQVGSIGQNDLGNFRFSVDDQTFGAAVTQLGTDGYIVFSGNVRLEPGRHNLKLLGNVMAGNGKTLSFQLRRSSDIKIIDTGSNQSIIPSQFQAVSSGTYTINTGRLVITKSNDSPTGTVVAGASNVVLARYKLEAYSEEVRGGYGFRVSFVTNNGNIGSLRSVALYADGVKVSNSLTVKESSREPYKEMTCSSDCTFKIKPGSSVALEIRGDIYDNDGTNDIASNDTIQVKLLPSLSVTGMNSLAISESLVEPLLGNILTIVNTTPKTTFSFDGNGSTNNTYTVNVGDTVRLGWSTQYSYGGECTASGDWSGKKIEGNSENLTLTRTGTFNYILTCVNGLNGERGTDTATIVVIQ